MEEAKVVKGLHAPEQSRHGGERIRRSPELWLRSFRFSHFSCLVYPIVEMGSEAHTFSSCPSLPQAARWYSLPPGKTTNVYSEEGLVIGSPMFR